MAALVVEEAGLLLQRALLRRLDRQDGGLLELEAMRLELHGADQSLVQREPGDGGDGRHRHVLGAQEGVLRERERVRPCRRRR